jgi:sec-independent protein translocase protein TatA
MELFAIFLMGIPGGWEWIIIVLVVLLLFGGRKIPELMKGLGQGMKEFKKARNEHAEDKNEEEDAQKRDDSKF